MQKLIFLDIDGVLNVETYHYLEENDVWVCPEAGDTEFPLLYGDQPLNSRCLKNLQTLVDNTKADIVISSSWRILYPISSLSKMFKEVGLNINVVGETPYTPNYIRGEEIALYLADNADNNLNYVILDDSTDFHDWQLQYFVNTDPGFGLSEMDVTKATEILNG
jgi:hypothetical protein